MFGTEERQEEEEEEEELLTGDLIREERCRDPFASEPQNEAVCKQSRTSVSDRNVLMDVCSQMKNESGRTFRNPARRGEARRARPKTSAEPVDIILRNFELTFLACRAYVCFRLGAIGFGNLNQG